jgi:2-oxoglutarate ferredoxin oxidoreductase subunit alpha
MSRIAKGALQALRLQGKKVGLIRPITLWPFPRRAFLPISDYRSPITFLVIEMSYGQMLEDVRLAVEGRFPVEFLGRAGGGIPTEEEIVKKIEMVR